MTDICPKDKNFIIYLFNDKLGDIELPHTLISRLKKFLFFAIYAILTIFFTLSHAEKING